jgi:hypothetical protein
VQEEGRKTVVTSYSERSIFVEPPDRESGEKKPMKIMPREEVKKIMVVPHTHPLNLEFPQRSVSDSIEILPELPVINNGVSHINPNPDC